MANSKKQHDSQDHPQATSLQNKEHANAQVVEFQRIVRDELRQIRFGLELKFPVFRVDADHHPLDWLSRAERFFNFYKVPEDQKVALASNYFEGNAALEWLVLYERIVPSSFTSSSWTHFVERFLAHFGYGDIDDTLLRLKQQGGGVDVYITDFIRLVSRASKNWTDNQLKSFFINGLQDELRGDVSLYKPETLSKAIELARVLEERPPQGAAVEGFIPNLPRYQALFMGRTRVKVLMTSSTHHFISPSVLKGEDRRLIIKEDDPLFVKSLAGFGDWTTTEGRIDGAQLNLQGFQFVGNFYLLPNLRGCDMLLGNGWQGSTFAQYPSVSDEIIFIVNGKVYELTAEKHPPGTITQPCITMSVEGVRKSMLRRQ